MFRPTQRQSNLIFNEYKDYKKICEEFEVEPYEFNFFIEEVLRRGFNNICGIVKQSKETHKTEKQEIDIFD